MARFALPGLLPASILAKRFATPEARGLLAGAAAHSMLPLSAPLSGAFGILLTTLAHEVGWPVIEGGSARLVDALVTELETLGGQVTTGRWIRTLDELPSATTVLLDVTARRFVDLAGTGFPPGSGGPCAGSGTDRASARWTGRSPDRSRGWPSRATRRRPCIWGGPWRRWWPAKQRWPPTAIRLGRTASWSSRGWSIRPGPPVGGTRCGPTAMCRRARRWTWPIGSRRRSSGSPPAFVISSWPGWRHPAVAGEEHNPNYIGGDINGGAATLGQTIFRPTVRWNPYRTGIENVYLCSASTPPGGGVHGMCGVGAARAALADLGMGEVTAAEHGPIGTRG